jgi:hypothetical protein
MNWEKPGEYSTQVFPLYSISHIALQVFFICAVFFSVGIFFTKIKPLKFLLCYRGGCEIVQIIKICVIYSGNANKYIHQTTKVENYIGILFTIAIIIVAIAWYQRSVRR